MKISTTETQEIPTTRARKAAVAIGATIQLRRGAYKGGIESTYENVMGAPIDPESSDTKEVVRELIAIQIKGMRTEKSAAIMFLCGHPLPEEPEKELPQGVKTTPWGEVIELP